ncbi:MAG: preprotein translocase subunit YajC [Eubacterium sp.]|nr:preprotein translocase subunit YajC [Eubacterium sp.]
MGGNMWMIILYVVVIVGAMYFLLIRPQKKNEKKQKDLLGNLEVGDSVLTSSGFYGMVIDVQDDTVIVEFGGNKNCRIPMQKQAIVDVEKPTEE